MGLKLSKKKNKVTQIKPITISEEKGDLEHLSTSRETLRKRVDEKHVYFHKALEDQTSTYYYYHPLRPLTAPETTNFTVDKITGKIEDQTYHFYNNLRPPYATQMTSQTTDSQINMNNKTFEGNIKFFEVKPLSQIKSEGTGDQSLQAGFIEASEKIEDQTFHYYYHPLRPSISNGLLENLEDSSHHSFSLKTPEKFEDQTNFYYYCPLRSIASQGTKTMDGQMTKRKHKLAIVKPMLFAKSGKAVDRTYHYYYNPLKSLFLQRTVKNSTIIFSTLMFFIASLLGVTFVFACE